MRTVTDVQASFGSCCFCAAAAMAVDSSAEAMDVVTDATVSGSSYSFCAAAATTMASDASDRLIGLPNTKKAGIPAFFVMFFLFFASVSASLFASARPCFQAFFLLFSCAADKPHQAHTHDFHL